MIRYIILLLFVFRYTCYVSIKCWFGIISIIVNLYLNVILLYRESITMPMVVVLLILLESVIILKSMVDAC